MSLYMHLWPFYSLFCAEIERSCGYLLLDTLYVQFDRPNVANHSLASKYFYEFNLHSFRAEFRKLYDKIYVISLSPINCEASNYAHMNQFGRQSIFYLA